MREGDEANRYEFDERRVLDNGGTCRQVEYFVQTSGKVRKILFIIAGRIGYCVRWVEEGPYANGWTVVGFPKAVIEI